jgi:GNAT superfamily N-acetyltransferase
MEVGRFLPADVPLFLALAGEEGWLCDRWELDFLRQSFPAGCLVARCAGEPIGFITTIKYRQSGWVGNLLVREQHRGRGVGRLLMERGLAALQQAKVATIWLTASADGRPLYEKLGFTALDTIQRWRGVGQSGQPRPEVTGESVALESQDALGWGDRRDVLIRAIASRGVVIRNGAGFLVMQTTSGGTQLGPWGGQGQAEAAELLAQARSRAGSGTALFLDSPAANGVAQELLGCAGFSVCGSTLLMAQGVTPAYEPARVFALASMGSMG